MPSLMIESPQQLHQAAGAWGSMYSVQEPVKPRHVFVLAPAAKKPATYGIRRRNLETCTEAIGCETGAVDTILAGSDGDVEAEYCAEGKGRVREHDEVMARRARWSERRDRARPLPPPLTTLARGAGRVRMVHERRGGRLEVYAVSTPGVLEAERSGGRLRLRLLPLPCGADTAAAACCPQERQGPEAKETKQAEDEYGFSNKYVPGGRCVDSDDGTAASSGSWSCVSTHAYSRTLQVAL
jgi:hypothetical protein